MDASRDEVIEDDELNDDISRGQNRQLDTSVIQVEKRSRGPRSSNSPEESDDEFMSIVEQIVCNADVQVRDALTGADADRWMRTIIEEIKSHLEHGT